MNLRFYDKKNTLGMIRDDLNPIIKIVSKGGFIKLNHRACELLVIKEGGRVILAQDESSLKDWYVAKTDSLAGFSLRSYQNSGTLQLQSRKVTTLILDSLAIRDTKPVVFQMADTPTVTKDHQLFAILYKNHS